MKTYDTYGSAVGTPATDDERWRNVQRVALQVQRLLGVELGADEDAPPRGTYLHRDVTEHEVREVLVLDNLTFKNMPRAYPEIDRSIVVQLNDTSKPDTEAEFETVGLTLLRARRREYAMPQRSAGPSVELYGAAIDAANTVATLCPLFGMAFDGNRHAATGGDSHYYGESERFGGVLVFDNTRRPLDDLPFPTYPDVRAVIIVVNPTVGVELRSLMNGVNFTLLKTAGSEAT